MFTPQGIAVLAAITIFVLCTSIIWDNAHKDRIKLASKLAKNIDEQTAIKKVSALKKASQDERTQNLIQKMGTLLGDRERINFNIKLAGMNNKISADEILLEKLLGYGGMIAFIVIGFVMGIFGSNDSLKYCILIGVVLFIVFGFLPEQKIKDTIKAKNDAIIHQLPDFIDLLQSTCDSGMVIQEAITEVTKYVDNEISDEFMRVMAETTTNGGDWKGAMEQMAERNNISELSTLVSDILVSYENGTSISQTLKEQSRTLREAKNFRMDAKAKAMTVKMLIPMVIFMFLPIMVIMIAPAVLQMAGEM